MPADTLSLAGKVAIITGSGRENGIGAGIVQALARNGAAVTINCVTDGSVPRAEAFAESIRKKRGRAIVVQANIDSVAGAQKLVAKTLEAFSTDQIDILVNNAGTAVMAPTLDTSAEDISRILDVNVKGTIYVTSAVVPHMPFGGRIINISSTSSRLGQDTLPIYGASKAAIDNLTFSWAKEWGRSKGLTVNAVAPGPVATDLTPAEYIDMALGPEREITRAADRYGTIEGLGDAVLLLVSEKARWITGQYISVSGGVTGL